MLIWTLQRSGATHLVRCLERFGGLPVLQQEPFNADRMHGDISRAWLADADGSALNQRVHAVCAGRRLIKHCVELVPWPVTQALMTQASALGFVHLVLYRRQSLDRLLSLAFARRTGAWDPGTAGKVRRVLKQAHNHALASELDHALGKPLPVRQLVAHETLCAQRLNEVWRQLPADPPPLALAFEDLHAAPRADAMDTLRALARSLHAPGPAERIEAFAAEVIDRGDQRTREHYLQLEGADALRAALQRVAPFVPTAA